MRKEYQIFLSKRVVEKFPHHNFILFDQYRYINKNQNVTVNSIYTVSFTITLLKYSGQRLQNKSEFSIM